MKPRALLFELGCEELPAHAQQPLAIQMHISLQRHLKEACLDFGDMEHFATPRRLAVLVHGLSARQPSRQVTRRGPALERAYGTDGTPTRALLAFAKSCQTTPEHLEQRELPKGTWLFYSHRVAGEPTESLLPDILTATVAGLRMPRNMHWGSDREAFIRPVRWVCALWGTRVLPLQHFGLSADRTTRGHRVQAPNPLRLRNAQDYPEALRERGGVIANFDERKEHIRSQVQTLAEQHSLQPLINDHLLEEVCALTEWPVALAGRFDSAFLEIPQEVLITSMQTHQKYFPLLNQDGTLSAEFITISNLQSNDPAQVIIGNERVLRPRLADAAFFYQTDLQTSLESLTKRLDKVVFQRELGSLAEKSTRLQALVQSFADCCYQPGIATTAVRAAQLAKADLLSQLVQEFPTLQGIAGGYYASAQGESKAVATAIAEHYLPQGSTDSVPSTPAGALLTIADRMDNIAGLFFIGRRPDANSDPFALRRAAVAVIRICLHHQLRLGFDVLIRLALAPFAPKGSDRFTEVAGQMRQFFHDRLPGWYREQGIGTQVVQAVMACDPGSPYTANLRILALAQAANTKTIRSLAITNKRVAHLLAQSEQSSSAAMPYEQPDPRLFTEPAERALYEAITTARRAVTFLLVGETGETIADTVAAETLIETLNKLNAPVNTFFDQVMVMHEDWMLRENRLRTLHELRQLFLQVADLSMLAA